MFLGSILLDLQPSSRRLAYFVLLVTLTALATVALAACSRTTSSRSVPATPTP